MGDGGDTFYKAVDGLFIGCITMACRHDNPITFNQPGHFIAAYFGSYGDHGNNTLAIFKNVLHFFNFRYMDPLLYMRTTLYFIDPWPFQVQSVDTFSSTLPV